MLAWVVNLDFAASGADAPEPPAASDAVRLGTPLLLGTGCWLMPLLAAVLLGVR